MEIPDSIQDIMLRIEDSEKSWKAYYMAVWGYAHEYLHTNFKKPLWDKKLKFCLPRSKQGFHYYSPKELAHILTTKDDELALIHLQHLFSLFEELISRISLEINGIKLNKKNYHKLAPNIVERFNLTATEKNELKLARETRNYFIHKDSKIDTDWIDIFQKIRGENPKLVEGMDLSIALEGAFEAVEEWHVLFLKIIEKIKDWIILKKEIKN